MIPCATIDEAPPSRARSGGDRDRAHGWPSTTSRLACGDCEPGHERCDYLAGSPRHVARIFSPAYARAMLSYQRTPTGRACRFSQEFSAIDLGRPHRIASRPRSLRQLRCLSVVFSARTLRGARRRDATLSRAPSWRQMTLVRSGQMLAPYLAASPPSATIPSYHDLRSFVADSRGVRALKSDQRAPCASPSAPTSRS